MNNKNNNNNHHQLLKILFMPFSMMKRRDTMGCKEKPLSPSFKSLLMPFFSERSRTSSSFQAIRFWKIRWWIVEGSYKSNREGKLSQTLYFILHFKEFSGNKYVLWLPLEDFQFSLCFMKHPKL